ncbi:hypothetical protein AJ78_02713 [Emergomyces pasteurianus Ep9510]|uniref:Uncharacterized protein n=1 Tax=Emergomyces pasteurianus Ep9510 TaxID=1447872 RepID=A0A1J9PL55_9EURO|nr:hypothetical protein AJ78_02713 [Emergomyces pasteurianus Ep9510]
MGHFRALSISEPFYADAKVVTARAIVESEGKLAPEEILHSFGDNLEAPEPVVFGILVFHYGAFQSCGPGKLGDLVIRGFVQLTGFILWRRRTEEHLESVRRQLNELPCSPSNEHRQADYLYASAGLNRRELDPSADAIIIDQSPYPSPESAVCDISKIVSNAQIDDFSVALAIEGLRQWETNELYSPYYRKCGLVFIGEKG